MVQPFATLADAVPARSPLRQAITDNTLTPESVCIEALAGEATLPAELSRSVQEIAARLITALRDAGISGLVQGLVQEYDLSTREGLALMGLAEALLRIPDTATRDALIRDKIARGDWRGHAGRSSSFFVDAAARGLVISERILSPRRTAGSAGRLTGGLADLVSRCGKPVIRHGADLAIRLMGGQFITGQTIEIALRNSRRTGKKGFRHSYDMLGEAAATAQDAARYYRDYEHAIHAIGKAAGGQGVFQGPGISVKLSALHPRYSRLQRERVMTELLPHLRALAQLACRYDIGFSIDAEEADRLELSLDLFEALCSDETLKGWQGLGFVVQAYQKRAPFVLDLLIDLARSNGRRLMVRLVKGAYWDSEIRRAQVDGLSGFPVFTTKAHTDISYIACARKLLAAPDAVFPQFATHNAQTLATILTLAGPDFSDEDYEFQCLHGMGEALYREVAGPEKYGRPVRVYAPVGTHETLLAYLVRRLLENGATSSFVNQIQDKTISVDDLTADPVSRLNAQPSGAAIRLPENLYQPERLSSAGLDLSDENALRCLAGHLSRSSTSGSGSGTTIRNPADHRDVVGTIVFSTPQQVDVAIGRAQAAFEKWRKISVSERAGLLTRTAEALEADRPRLMGILVREAGKSLADAVAEIREAVDFLRYYAAGIVRSFSHETHRPLGPVVCISPWNFPLAIFLGQVSAALAAGNTVLAKPAEETPLIAREAVRILHDSGFPADVVQLLPGAGDVGAGLVGDARVRGVLFTGSTEVARLIRRQLAGRLNPDGAPVPLIAETGGQNALVVDSSALAEQVVADVISSAFDSAGQRCSALRILCLQEECADRVLTMLRGAMAELSVGNPGDPATDIGPVISVDAQASITAHIDRMRARGYRIWQTPPAPGQDQGSFVPPTLIEIPDIAVLRQEVFGPVLHVVRYSSHEIDRLIDDINATGYALTFGIHTRIDETVARVVARSHAGNIYVNRNLIGAVVGVQPFGGHGLSGTGPKAGGPLYLRRLLSSCPPVDAALADLLPVPAVRFRNWLRSAGGIVADTRKPVAPAGATMTLPGPVGEENVYSLIPRGTVLCAGPDRVALIRQIEAALATGNRVAVPPHLLTGLPPVPPELEQWIHAFGDGSIIDAALCAGNEDERLGLEKKLAGREGQIVSLHVPRADGSYASEWLVLERVCSTNTTAAGGNAALMTARQPPPSMRLASGAPAETRTGPAFPAGAR